MKQLLCVDQMNLIKIVNFLHPLRKTADKLFTVNALDIISGD